MKAGAEEGAMPVCRRDWNCVAVSFALLLLSFSTTAAFGQASYAA
jgi:hypothetical protein